MDRQNFTRFIRNAGALLASDFVTRLTSYAVYALVARTLGTQDFGRLSLGLTLMYAFQMLASAGAKTLLTREIAKDRSLTASFLVNGTLMVAGMSLVSIIAMALLGAVMQYVWETRLILLLLSLSLLPASISVVLEGVFAGWERMHYIMLANAPMNVLRIGLIIAALTLGIGLPGVVLAMFVSTVMLVLVESALVRRIAHITLPKPELRLAHARTLLSLLRQSFTFLGIEFVIATAASIDYLVISKLASEANLGLFNAATQIIAPITIMVQTLAYSLLPLLSRQAQSHLADMGRSTGRLLEAKLTVMLPLVIGLFFVCEPAFQLLYGRPEFAAASPLLRIIVWGNITVVFTSVLGQTLVAGMRERQVLKIVLAITITQVIMNAILVSWLGVTGAAISMLVSKLILTVPHITAVRALLPGLSIAQSINKPALASLGMVLTFIGARSVGTDVLATLGISAVVYLGLLGLLHLQTLRRERGRKLGRMVVP